MKILIIEDEHKIADSIKKGLEAESYAVDVVYDGEEGLDFALAEQYDLIILDRMLPGLDGMAICERLRKEHIVTPVLMLTAKSEVNDIVDGLNNGADDYLTKPFAFLELLARIKALRRRPKSLTGSTWQVGDLTLNTVTYEVQRAGKEINLSRKEFALLEYLMSHPNRLFSKEQIINNIWDYDADVVQNSVEVYIAHLRNKIDKPFIHSPNLIKSVRRFGYKISGS